MSMLHLLPYLLLAASTGQKVAVPRVTAGPASTGAAPQVEAPITKVTVYSDRARVHRTAKIDVQAGITVKRLPDLAGAVLLDTIRVTGSGARILRLEASPVERERFAIAQVEKELDELEKITDAIGRVEQKLGIEQNEISFLGQIQPALAVPEAERRGRPLMVANPTSWFQVIDFFDLRRANAQEQIRKLKEELTKKVDDRNLLQQKIAEMDMGGFSERMVETAVFLESQRAGHATVELSYFIPGAYWKPVYDLQFDPKRSTLTVRTAAMVQQATGEDWNDIALHLSTAIPGRGIDLPNLLTWTLGEKKEFMPHPRAKRRTKAQPLHPPPAALPTRAEEDRARTIQSLKDRLATLLAPQPETTTSLDADRLRDQVGSSQPSYRKRSKRGRKGKKEEPPPPPPRPSSPKPMIAHALAERSYDEADSGASSGGWSLFGGGSSRSARSGPSYVRTPLNLFETVHRRGPRFADRDLPAVIAGGLDYVYSAHGRITVASSNEQRRVPLEVASYPVQSFHEATPSLSTTAYLKAKVINRSDRALLRGPANIFVGNEFVAEAKIETTGPGGTMDFPLGADENVRLVRRVLPETKTEGIFSKDDVTTYSTIIEVGNYKRNKITIVVTDQIPKSRNDDIEVELVSTSIAPIKPPDEEGLMRWRIEIPPGKTKTIKLTYSITRPADWQLYQN